MKRVVVLKKLYGPHLRFKAALWASVPAELRVPDASRTSEYSDLSAAELTAIRDGSVREKVVILEVPPGEGIQDVQTTLMTLWERWQEEASGEVTWQRYGTYWNGTAWVNP